MTTQTAKQVIAKLQAIVQLQATQAIGHYIDFDPATEMLDPGEPIILDGCFSRADLKALLLLMPAAS
jgi:hypothetical protein